MKNQTFECNFAENKLWERLLWLHVHPTNYSQQKTDMSPSQLHVQKILLCECLLQFLTTQAETQEMGVPKVIGMAVESVLVKKYNFILSISPPSFSQK